MFRIFVVFSVLSIALISFKSHAQSKSASQDVKAIEGVLKQQFPRSAIEPFECSASDGKTLCKNLVSHPKPRGGTQGVNYLLELKPDGALSTIVMMTAGPMMAEGKKEADYITMLYAASAIAVLTVTAPEIPVGSRMPFVTNVLKSGDNGVTKGAWEFTGGSSIFATFSAKKL
jgi:predicted aconitase with swiveling domain